jgi:hypothetical protein
VGIRRILFDYIIGQKARNPSFLLRFCSVSDAAPRFVAVFVRGQRHVRTQARSVGLVLGVPVPLWPPLGNHHSRAASPVHGKEPALGLLVLLVSDSRCVLCVRCLFKVILSLGAILRMDITIFPKSLSGWDDGYVCFMSSLMTHHR